MADLPEQNMQTAVVLKHQEAIETLLKQVERSAAQQATIMAGWKAALLSHERYRQGVADVVSTLRQIQRSRERLDIKCDKAIIDLNVLTELNRGDARRVVTVAVTEDREQENREQENREQEDHQRAATRYLSRGLRAFILTLLATFFAYHKL